MAPRQLVVGLGVVGSALQRMLDCEGWDIKEPTKYPKGPFDVLHIAYPYSGNFVFDVLHDRRNFEAGLTVIHSTVPIGTSRRVDAVHSPILGRHASMDKDLVTYPKWFGGERAEEAATLFADKVDTFILPNSDHTEALKLLCLAKFGAAVAMSKYELEVCDRTGLSVPTIRAWDWLYNKFIPDERLKRTRPIHEHGCIKGHCVTPGVELLDEFQPSLLLKGILEYA